MAYGFGLILGPALGGALGQITYAAPIYAAGIISLISVVFIYFMLPESLSKKNRVTTPLKIRDFNPFLSIGDMLQKPGIALILVVSMLFNFTFDGVTSTCGIFMIDKFSAQPWTIGFLFALSGIAIFIGQMVVAKHLKTTFGLKQSGMISLVGGAAAAAVTFFVPSFWMLFPLIFLLFLAVSPMFSVLTSIATSQVSAQEQGQLAGVFAAGNSLVAALGPLWAGLVYDHVMPGSPLWMGAILFILAGWILSRFNHHKKENAPQMVAEH